MADIYYLDLNLAETDASSRYVPSDEEAEARFRAAADRVGLKLEKFVFKETPKVVRCATVDDKGQKKSGWYVLHKDGDLWHGALGDWRVWPDYERFVGADERTIDPERRKLIEQAQQLRQQELDLERAQKAAEAAALVPNLKPADPEHPYLVAKGIRPHGALAYGPDILLPIRDLHGNVVSLQTIGPDGSKSFKTGCTSRGVYVIGGQTPNVVICEGYATGASIHEATGMRVYVTFNAGNMAALTREIAMLEGRFGGRIIIAADHDKPSQHHVNIGMEKAEQAAASIGGAQILMPPLVGTDWNDVAKFDPQYLRAAFAAVRPLVQPWQAMQEHDHEGRDWLYGDIYIRGYVSMTIAPGGLGKSTLALTEAIAIATGRNLLGITPQKRCKWFYFNAEDPLSEIKLKVSAICKAHGIDERELEGWLFIQSGRDMDLNLATGENGDIVEPLFQQMQGTIRYYGAEGMTLDPLANMHDSPETNDVFRKLSKRLSRLAEEANIAIHIVHHSRKLGGRQAEIEDARGGGAMVNATRAARALHEMEDDEVKRYGLDDGIDYFCVAPAGKSSLARRSSRKSWYVREGIKINCRKGPEWVGVVRSWSPPYAFDQISKDDTRAVQAALLAREEPAKADIKNHDWVGIAIAAALDWDINDAEAKGTIKGLIAGWLETGVLAETEVHNKKSNRDVKAIVVGPNRL